MRGALALILCWGLTCAATCSELTELLNQANRLELEGRFKQAASKFSAALKENSWNDKDRQTLEFELDRLARIKEDFPLKKESLFRSLTNSVSGLTLEEFNRWLKEGRFDSREIDGERYYMRSSVSNLFFRHPELNSRRIGLKDQALLEHAVWESVAAIKKAAQREHQTYVLPKRFAVTMTVTTVSNIAPAGELIRAWLPIPRRYRFQDGFELLSTSSPVKHIADESSPARSLLLEQPAAGQKPTEFRIDYRFTFHAVAFNPKPEEVEATSTNAPALQPFLLEAPHVVFTPELRALSETIAGGERNPLVRARKYYNWISEHIQYSFAIEYSTIRNIGDYCRSKGYGDCGQEALLFITLCRVSGIPARWQSGWNLFPGLTTIHDWSEIYLEPYGWIPVDPYMGVFATRYANSLTSEQKREVREFYFGGLDQYRIAANSDHCQALDPPKHFMRSDTVDFQRGELETPSHNLYFDQFDYDLTWKEVDLSPAE